MSLLKIHLKILSNFCVFTRPDFGTLIANESQQSTKYSPISEFQNFIYDDSYIGQPQPRIATGAGARQQAVALCPTYI